MVGNKRGREQGNEDKIGTSRLWDFDFDFDFDFTFAFSLYCAVYVCTYIINSRVKLG